MREKRLKDMYRYFGKRVEQNSKYEKNFIILISDFFFK